jgi:hypothetical protein
MPSNTMFEGTAAADEGCADEGATRRVQVARISSP